MITSQISLKGTPPAMRASVAHPLGDEVFTAIASDNITGMIKSVEPDVR